ncbi:peptidase S8/S53 domain-containing protein [Xylariaceae sp. FL0662B]|nr:peptidase S8/S53 domain-containing protein [Xylariaceae sp. FL0662B]
MRQQGQPIMETQSHETERLDSDPTTLTQSQVAPDDPPPENQGVRRHCIMPKDGKNKSLVAETEKFLKDLTKQDNINPGWDGDELLCWSFPMSDDQAEEANKHEGILTCHPSLPAERFHVQTDQLVERATHPEPSTVEASKSAPNKAKRSIKYTIQSNAVTELITISQPSTIPNLENLKNYVYENHAGENTWVYHIDAGVEYNTQKEEFTRVDPNPIVVPAARNQNAPASRDDSDGHGTCTASKAVGSTYGVAKKAMLVVVKLPRAMELEDFFLALSALENHFKANTDRVKRSVITLSLGWAVNPNTILEAAAIKARIRNLMNMGIPIVVASGNNANDPGRMNVDTIPAVWEAPDYPLIVVGSTNSRGKLSAFSQRGPHVTLHATGEDITCMSTSGAQPITGKQGTSYSAPQVAGEIANLLSYDEVPFDTSDGSFVKNLKEYLQSDKGSWTRIHGLRMLWNGVQEKDNPKGGAPPPNPCKMSTYHHYVERAGADSFLWENCPPKKECEGLGGRKYISRDGIKDIIEDKFCPDAVKQGTLDPNSGAISRKYNEGTMEGVFVAMEWQPGLNFKPTSDDCTRDLLGDLIDGCDANDPKDPENYKGGGSIKVGEVTYRITPARLRQSADKGRQGGCSSTYKLAFNEYSVWGSGWATSDFGNALKDQIYDCALLPDTWRFEYGLGDDGREWTAGFRTGVFQRGCVGQAGKEAGAPEDFGCSGSG